VTGDAETASLGERVAVICRNIGIPFHYGCLKLKNFT